MDVELKGSIWPLWFSHRGLVIGQEFIAEVNIRGRLTARNEPDGVWLDGVNPGALAVGAESLPRCGPRLREALSAVLNDFATEADSFEAFQRRVTDFVQETDDDSVTEWQAAVADVRAGRTPAPPGLESIPAEGRVQVVVTKKHLTPADNPDPAEDGLATAA